MARPRCSRKDPNRFLSIMPIWRLESIYTFAVAVLLAFACPATRERPKSGLAIEARAAVPVCFRKLRRDEDIVLPPGAQPVSKSPGNRLLRIRDATIYASRE